MLVRLSVLIKYELEKAGGWRLETSLDTLLRLRKHLTSLRMPHPKPDNVGTIDGQGVLRFFWVTQDDSPLYRHVTNRVKIRNVQVMRSCFIMRIQIIVHPELTDPPSAPLRLPLASRRDSFSNFSPVDAQPEVGTSNMDSQAQEFLDGLKLGSPAVVPEGDTVDTRVPLSSPKRASSVASSTRSSRHEIPEPVSTAMKQEESMDAWGVENAEHAAESRVSTPESEDMVMSPSPIPGLITFPLRAANFDDGMDVDPLAPSEIQLGAPGESDTPTDTLAIEQLSKTLMDVRKEVASHIIKERAILLALKKFDSTSAPVKEPANPALDIPSSENVFIAKIRLQLLKNELENARSKRLAVEQSVKEIAKEGRAPFICPALMNAFIGVSRLSAEALKAED